jgi:hypothetical protein
VTTGHVDSRDEGLWKGMHNYNGIHLNIFQNHRGEIGAPSNQTSQPEASSDIMTSATQSTVSSAPDQPIDLRVEM